MKGERVEGRVPATIYKIVDNEGDTLTVHVYDDGDVILAMKYDREIWLKPNKVAELRDCLTPDPLRTTE